MNKIKKEFLAMLSCMGLGAVLAPAAFAAQAMEGPATGDAGRNYLPLIVGVAVACLVIIAALVVVGVYSAKRKKSGGEDGAPTEAEENKDNEDKQK